MPDTISFHLKTSPTYVSFFFLIPEKKFEYNSNKNKQDLLSKNRTGNMVLVGEIQILLHCIYNILWMVSKKYEINDKEKKVLRMNLAKSKKKNPRIFTISKRFGLSLSHIHSYNLAVFI